MAGYSNATMEETTQERQDNEFEALQAMFPDQIVDNRPALAWKVWRPLDMLFTVYPSHSMDQEIHCSVTLHIECCIDYPNKPPKISIHKLNGLSNENAAKLIVELNGLANSLCGEVMIFELIQLVQSFLYTHNKPTMSFYDEMVQRLNQEEKVKQQDQQERENAEREKIKSEVQKRKEILKNESRRVHRSSISQEKDTNGHGDAPELVFYADQKTTPIKKPSKKKVKGPCTCNSKGVQILRLTQRNNKKMHLGKCLGHSSNGSSTNFAIDADTGDVIIAKKWTLNPPTDFQIRNRQMIAIDNDLRVTSRLKHPSLVPYLSMECQQDPKRANLQNVYLLRDFVLGASLSVFKSKDNYSDELVLLPFVRQIALGVFRALKELHAIGLVHRDVCAENVFVDDSGAVKLVGIALDARLTDIVEDASCCDKQTKADDIIATAQMLLEFIKPNATEIPPNLPSSVRDFFFVCLTEEESSQLPVEQLLKHSFLVDPLVEQPSTKKQSIEEVVCVDVDALMKIASQTSAQSRVNREFEVLGWIGKGGFGDVIKAKNKLDSGLYAIKRIKLNPVNVKLNRKITREVNLLSRLNHENVVRYYNAWIESIDANAEDCVSEKTATKASPRRVLPSIEAAAAKLAPAVVMEWSISKTPVLKRERTDSEESDDDDTSWNGEQNAAEDDETSFSIAFEGDEDKPSDTFSSETQETRPPTENIRQMLYIQMEYCEKHTLRQAIDEGLSNQNFRAWRLFREIVNGLSHVHKMGMIHRDLKPVNIFLDSTDHVKLGDFGLATLALAAQTDGDDKVKTKAKEIVDVGSNLTGQIGTALYVAPEQFQCGKRVTYNQMVDIYSLGIILFEMFHPPMETAMERMKILTDLRRKEIKMPDAFVVEENSKLIYLLNWLLNHDPGVRPTCIELLASEHVPRPVEENVITTFVSHTLCYRHSGTYKRMMESCMDQKFSAAEDITYHSGLKIKSDDVLDCIKDVAVKVFKTHGASEFAPPLLTPRAKAWDTYPNAVKLMSAVGWVCHLPHDLRLPFARHVAYNDVKCMRRYVVDRVYRERHVDGFHPREILECAFDIVVPKTDSFWFDAEVLYVACRVASEVNLKVAITIGHTLMLKTLLLACSMPSDRHDTVYPVLVDFKLGRITNLQLNTHLTSLCLKDRDIANLMKLTEIEVPVSEVVDSVSQYTNKPEWSQAIKQATAEIDAVLSITKEFELECPVLVAPLLAYNATQHSGLFWQLSVQRERPGKHRASDIIAVGGRYDVLVEEFWKIARSQKESDAQLKSTTIGCSIAIERMGSIVKKLEIDVNPPFKTPESTTICVCVHSSNARSGQRATRRGQIARELWTNNCRVITVECSSPNDAHEMTGANIVMVDDNAAVKVVCFGDNRIREHSIPFMNIADFVKQKLNLDAVRSPEGPNRSCSWTETDNRSSGLNISVTYINEKLMKNSKRQLENQIHGQVQYALTASGCPSSRIRACVIAMCCEGACVRALAASLDLDELKAGRASATLAVDCFPKKKKLIESAVEELQCLITQNMTKSNDEKIVYALYSISDSICKIIT